MKIAGIPIRDMDSASCRIRFFRFLRALPEGYEWQLFDHKYDFDVLYVQKIAKDWVIDVIKKAKKKGKAVVFDRDDIRKDWGGINHEIIMRLADVVTTDTELRQIDFQQHTDKPVYVVQDCIDYIDSPESRIDVNRKMSSVVTFGHKASVLKAAEHINAIDLPYKAYICSEKIKAINGKFIEWNRDKFIKKLRKFDVAVLAHDDTDIGNMKSNNRLLVCMSIGLPAVVTNTKAYADTMKAVGFSWLVVDNPSTIDWDLSTIVSKLSDYETRRYISSVFINYVWFKYDPKISGQQLAEVFNKAVGK